MRSRVTCESAVSACISPSTSRSGAAARISSNASRILQAEPANRRCRSRNARPGRSSARCRSVCTWRADICAISAMSLRTRVVAHLRVGDEQRALGGDQHAHRREVATRRGISPMISRIERSRLWKPPTMPQIIASASPRFKRDSGNDCRVGAHQQARRIRRDPAPPRRLYVGRDIVAVARDRPRGRRSRNLRPGSIVSP